MPYPEELKEAIAQHALQKKVKIGLAGKIYSPEEIAFHVRNETEIGKKIIEAVVRGAVERLGR